VVEKTSALFGRTRKDIAVELDLMPGLLAVLMDHTQLDRVLLNLFVNAGQAMPDGGRLVLRAENMELGSNEVAPHGAAPGRFVKLAVVDNGVGMDCATQARLFEPFFTTKSPGQGTGLGLASVYGIIKNHAGFITVESELGKGTTFNLFLPATEQLIAKKEVSQPPSIRPGTGTILVVDDEEQIVKAYARLLNKIGYDVLTASSGKQAVELMRQHGKGISLVILDMIMPQMSGPQTYEALQEVAPGTKVLLATGYSIDRETQEILARGCNGFIQKPFDAAALSAKLQEIL
jgi:CheY-like chemotaxis protein